MRCCFLKLPCYYGIRATGNIFGSGFLEEHLAVVIPTPVGTDVVLGCRVGDLVSLIAGIDMIQCCRIHDEILPQGMIGVTGDGELPWSSYTLSLSLFASPCVIRVAIGFTQEEWQVDGITGKQERTACLVVGF